MGLLRSLGEALLTTKWEEIRAIGFEDFVTSLRKVRPSVSKDYMHFNSGTTNMEVRDRNLCEYGG
jgi:hypothetical protein